jgi:hypothetical protein
MPQNGDPGYPVANQAAAICRTREHLGKGQRPVAVLAQDAIAARLGAARGVSVNRATVRDLEALGGERLDADVVSAGSEGGFSTVPSSRAWRRRHDPVRRGFARAQHRHHLCQFEPSQGPGRAREQDVAGSAGQGTAAGGGATTLAEGNALLPAFVADYNARFAQAAGIRYRGVELAYRTFDKIQQVDQGAIIENKRLGAALAFIREEQLRREPLRRSTKAPRRRDQRDARLFKVG